MSGADPGSYEHFPALAAIPSIRHAFCGRVPGVEVKVDRAEALARLAAQHEIIRAALEMDGKEFVIGEQIHGSAVAVVDAEARGSVGQVDGLITADPRVCLGVYVADCCAVFLVEPERRVIALLHSGRKGSELGITGVAIQRMRAEFGCDPAKLIVQLSPCIRPPHFEIDFAALIRRDCAAAGVRHVHDCGTCTGSNVDRYYSYRIEKGQTGRMLALLALHES